MGDSRRFDLLAQFIESIAPNKKIHIADVAAGKGYLSLALKQRGYKNIVSFEPNPRNKDRHLDMRARMFEGGHFDLIVGLHPDEATDVILQSAINTGATAVVVPCCAKPTIWKFNPPIHYDRRGIPPHRQDQTYQKWMQHLLTESRVRKLFLKQTTLPMEGRNIVLWGKIC